MVLSSTAASAVDLATLLGLLHLAHLAAGLAGAAGCVAGGVVNFALNRAFVFRRGGRGWLGQLLRYAVLVVLAGALIAGGIIQLGVTVLGLPVLAAKAIAAALVLGCWNYPVSARLVFRRSVTGDRGGSPTGSLPCSDSPRRRRGAPSLHPGAPRRGARTGARIAACGARRLRNRAREGPARLAADQTTQPHQGGTVMLPTLSVIIPAYNEEARIAPTLQHVLTWIPRLGLPWELIVVDDGSEDGTCAVVRRELGSLPNAHLIESRPNRGKGHAVRTGMLAARGDLRLFMDADNSTPISELPGLLEHVRRGAHVAIGSRRAPGARTDVQPPWYRRLWSRVANRVVQAGLLSGIRDTQCGFKLFTGAAAREVFSRCRTEGWGFDLEALALAQRLGYPVAEHPVSWSDDPRSRIHPLRDAWRITREFFRIRRAFERGEYALEEATLRRDVC